MPRVLQKHDYPAGWGDIAFEQAAMQGFDPLLLLGLVRQESTFNARAQSSARAMGLTQVIPSTANEIARHLGRSDDFQVRDLLRPGISLEFGAWYLARQLERYGGQIFPALAAYNAGGGNADTWLREFGDDPDVFAERIPFAETHTYVKHVYENYRIYRQLYQ
jgi:soluble lytic murein transglycosylase